MNFKNALLVVASILALVATEARADAPERSPAAIGTTSSPPLTFARGKTSSGWLPFEYVAGTRIFVRATINGRPVLAMLDSGASSTVLDRRFASSLGLSPKGDLTGQGAGGSTQYSVVQGVTVKLGDLSWNGGDAVAIDLSAVEKQVGHPLPMVLGGELFRDAVVEIDFKRRRIAFHNPLSYRAAPDAHAVALTPAGENQAISVLVEGRAAKLLFDLGNAGAVDLFPRFWEQSGFADNRRASTTFAGGVGGMSVQKVTMLRTIALGGATFKELPSRLEDRQSSLAARSGDLDGNIGMGVLSRFHLVVDFPHRRVLFAPPVDVNTPFRVNHAGLTLRPGSTGSKVLYVAPESPAAIAGVNVGDVIVAVDGYSADGKNGMWQDGPVGRIVRLRLADGQERIVTLASYF